LAFKPVFIKKRTVEIMKKTNKKEKQQDQYFHDYADSRCNWFEDKNIAYRELRNLIEELKLQGNYYVGAGEFIFRTSTDVYLVCENHSLYYIAKLTTVF
jgi:hypothetical protein